MGIFFVKSSYVNHWLFPMGNKPEFIIPANIKAGTDIVLKSQSQLQLASEVSVISLDDFIYIILILEDILVVSMCCLILSDSPVPTAENCFLLKSQLTFCRRHWAQLAFAVLHARTSAELGAPALMLHTLEQHDKAVVLNRLSVTCCPACRDCCAEADNKDGVAVDEKKDHPIELVKGKQLMLSVGKSNVTNGEKVTVVVNADFHTPN